MAKKVPMRLRYLRVKNELSPTGNNSAKTCEDELNALMTCWRVNGVDSVPCLSAVQALAVCSSIAVIIRMSRLYLLILLGCGTKSESQTFIQLYFEKNVL